MEKLPKDVVELITNKLTPREFFNYCKSDTGKEFCEKKEIWLRRIQKDFGFLLEGNNKDFLLVNYETDPKQAYLDLFSKTSRAAEQITEKILESLGKDFLNFLRDDYEKTMYELFFNYLLKMVNVLDILHTNCVYYLAYEYAGENSDWQKYLPELYNVKLFDFWYDEIGKIAGEYSAKIFQSLKSTSPKN